MGSAEHDRYRTWVDWPAARPSSEPRIKDVIGAGFTHGPESRFDTPSAGAFEAGGRADLMPPCSVLAELTGQALEADMRRLTDDELVGVTRAAHRNAAWQAAIELAAIDELASRRRAEVQSAGPPPAERAAAEIAVALTLPDGTAARLVDFANGLVMLDNVFEWLRRGEIDARKAEVFVQELSPLPWLQASIIACEHLQAATEMTSSQLRAALRRAVLAADPEAGRRRQRDARKEARVEWWNEHSGNGAIAGRELPAAQAMLAEEHITTLAKGLKAAGASGTLAQIQAAVLIALLTGRSPETLLPPPPEQTGPGSDDPPADAPPPDAPWPDDAPPDAPWPDDAPPDASWPDDPSPDAVWPDARPADAPPPDAPPPDAPPPDAPPPDTPWQPVQWPSGPLGTIHLTMPLSSWLGLTNNPGEVGGYGPTDAWTCRDLAEEMATWDRTRYCLTITTEDGQPLAHACTKSPPPRPGSGPAPPTGPPFPHGLAPPLAAADGSVAAWIASLRLEWLQRGTCDHSRETAAYRPSRLLNHLIKIRNPTCTAPGCRRPAQRSDIDHVIPYHLGGRTCECNCHPGCRRHHRCKGSAGWRVEMPEPGVLVWTLPHGRSYTTRAEPYPI
jgi:hypothetical protein